jgi:hypothetical protein
LSVGKVNKVEPSSKQTNAGEEVEPVRPFLTDKLVRKIARWHHTSTVPQWQSGHAMSKEEKNPSYCDSRMVLGLKFFVSESLKS